MRVVHFSRLLDIVSGSAFAGAKTKVQKSAIYRDFDTAKLTDVRFREIITSNLPVFYIVDIDLISREIVNGIVSDPKRFVSARYTESGPAAPGEKDFSLQDLASTESKTYTTLLKDLNTELSSALNKALPKKSFDAVYVKVDKLYQKLLNDLSKTGQSYSKYRNAATRFGFDMRKILSTEGIFIAGDGSNFVKLKTNQVLVIAPTFDSAVRKINETLLKPAEDLFESKYNIIVTKNNTGFKIGNLVNAGHTSAVTSTGNIIGVNMPSAQELQFRLSGSQKSFEIDRQVGSIYYDVGYSVEFNQNYGEVAANLLNMQFAFVISQPAKLNTNQIRVDEQRRLKSIIDKQVLPSLEAQLRQKLSSGVIDPTEISGSPTYLQYLEQTIRGILENKRSNKLKKSSKKSASTKLEIPTVLNTSTVIKANAKSKKASISINLKTSQILPVSSLVTLQSLLDTNLVQQVKQNMGLGNRRDILNLRSGRFAESVKVERLSESKQGMITAFYSYMKNPYATFSQGGQQELPRSRDPKLLIAKSIRDVASQQVTNRLRAVMV